MQKTIWIAREFDENSDYIRAYFDKTEAGKQAVYLANHLTASERKHTRVAVEGYPVEIAADDTRTAEELWRDLLDEDTPETRNPQEYEVIGANA